MAAAHRRGAERTARSPTSERASERGSPGGVEAQAPSPPRVAPAPWRRRPRGIRSGSGRREIADAAAGERGGGRRGSPGGAGREHRRFLAAPGPVGSRGCRVEAKRRPGRVGGPPSRPHSRRASASPSPAETAVYNGIRTKIRRQSGRDLFVTEWPFLEDSFVLSLGPRAAAPDRCGSPCQDTPPLGFLVRYQEGFMIVESMNESN